MQDVPKGETEARAYPPHRADSTFADLCHRKQMFRTHLQEAERDLLGRILKVQTQKERSKLEKCMGPLGCKPVEVNLCREDEK